MTAGYRLASTMSVGYGRYITVDQCIRVVIFTVVRLAVVSNNLLSLLFQGALLIVRTIVGREAFSRFGHALANLGDISGDGFDGKERGVVLLIVHCCMMIDLELLFGLT